jgi:hypothetical protein
MSAKVKMVIIAALATIVAAPALAGGSKMPAQSNDATHPSNAATRAYGPTFLPHKWSVDDACNLPSSRCAT